MLTASSKKVKTWPGVRGQSGELRHQDVGRTAEAASKDGKPPRKLDFPLRLATIAKGGMRASGTRTMLALKTSVKVSTNSSPE
ncbi:MAG: hypothetical protein PHE55_08730 [Methylococcaceae bacterium]|nr:hypothetical protein [Methylococcaceae bacterium]